MAKVGFSQFPETFLLSLIVSLFSTRWGLFSLFSLTRWDGKLKTTSQLFLSIRHHLVVWRFIKYQNNEMENFSDAGKTYSKLFSGTKPDISTAEKKSWKHDGKVKVKFNFHWDRIELQFGWHSPTLKCNLISSIKIFHVIFNFPPKLRSLIKNSSTFR